MMTPMNQMSQMSQMNAYDMPMQQADKVDLGLRPQPFSLRRMGKRPLAFEGMELCMAMSFVPGAPFWYEINVFRTTDNAFVVAVKTFFASEAERDLSRAWSCESFAQVMDLLEGYEPANDMRLDIDPEDKALSVPELAAAALMLRARAEEARRQYRSLVGEILFELEAE